MSRRLTLVCVLILPLLLSSCLMRKLLGVPADCAQYRGEVMVPGERTLEGIWEGELKDYPAEGDVTHIRLQLTSSYRNTDFYDVTGTMWLDGVLEGSVDGEVNGACAEYYVSADAGVAGAAGEPLESSTTGTEAAGAMISGTTTAAGAAAGESAGSAMASDEAASRGAALEAAEVNAVSDAVEPSSYPSPAGFYGEVTDSGGEFAWELFAWWGGFTAPPLDDGLVLRLYDEDKMLYEAVTTRD